jgi:cardiolipin synthase A/B
MPRKSKKPSILLSPKQLSLSSLIALLLYVFFQLFDSTVLSPPAQNKPTKTTSSIPTSPSVASYHDVQLYSNQTQNDLTQLYISTIRSAQQSIYMVIYSLTDQTVVQTLKEKSQEGIPVYIVCDAQASKGIGRLAGPHVTIIRRAGKGLTHQKILIVDEKILLIGSANLTGDSLREHGNLVATLENESLAQALVQKIKTMDEDGNFTPLAHQEAKVGSQTVELWVLPDDKGAANRVKTLLRSAKKSIRVAMFTWTRTDFTQGLIQAAKRGVKVETVIDRYSGKGASAKIVKMLAQAGIFVGLSTSKGLLHHKFAYIDENILINGSTNWTTSAFTKNDDCFLIIYPLTQPQQKQLNALWKVIQNESEKVNK